MKVKCDHSTPSCPTSCPHKREHIANEQCSITYCSMRVARVKCLEVIK